MTAWPGSYAISCHRERQPACRNIRPAETIMVSEIDPDAWAIFKRPGEGSHLLDT